MMHGDFEIHIKSDLNCLNVFQKLFYIYLLSFVETPRKFIINK